MEAEIALDLATLHYCNVPDVGSALGRPPRACPQRSSLHADRISNNTCFSSREGSAKCGGSRTVIKHSKSSFIGFSGSAVAAVDGGTQLLSGDVGEGSLLEGGSAPLWGPSGPQVSRLTRSLDLLGISPMVKPSARATTKLGWSRRTCGCIRSCRRLRCGSSSNGIAGAWTRSVPGRPSGSAVAQVRTPGPRDHPGCASVAPS